MCSSTRAAKPHGGHGFSLRHLCFFTAPVISRTEKGARCGNAFHVANGRVTMLLVLALLFAMATNASALVIVGNFTGGSAPGNTAASGTVVDTFNAHCKHRP
jgi:hypothetical protein